MAPYVKSIVKVHFYVHFSKHGIHGLGTPKTRGAFEDELTVNEVIKNNEDTESTWKMTLPSLWRFLTRLVRNSSVTNEAIFQKLNFLFSKFECKMTAILPIIMIHKLWVILFESNWHKVGHIEIQLDWLLYYDVRKICASTCIYRR